MKHLYDLRFILFAGFHSGMRKNEIIEARVDWFDLRNAGAVHIKNTDTFRIKDRETRFVPLTGQFRDFLRSYLDGKERDAFVLKPAVKHGKEGIATTSIAPTTTTWWKSRCDG